MPPKSSRESGYCRGGCLMLLVVVVVIVGGLLWGAASTYQGLYLMTSPSPRALNPLPSETDIAAIKPKLQALQGALTKNGTGEFNFSASDLNAWLFADPKNRDLSDHVRLEFDHDWLVVEVSVPLRFMRQLPGLPGFRDRFFNGKIAARISVDKGGLKVDNFDVTGNNHRLPWLFTGQAYRESLSEGLQSGLRTRFSMGEKLLTHLETIKIANDQLIVTIKN